MILSIKQCRPHTSVNIIKKNNLFLYLIVLLKLNLHILGMYIVQPKKLKPIISHSTALGGRF